MLMTLLKQISHGSASFTSRLNIPAPLQYIAKVGLQEGGNNEMTIQFCSDELVLNITHACEDPSECGVLCYWGPPGVREESWKKDVRIHI